MMMLVVAVDIIIMIEVVGMVAINCNGWQRLLSMVIVMKEVVGGRVWLLVMLMLIDNGGGDGYNGYNYNGSDRCGSD